MEAIHNVVERVNEAVMGGQEPVSTEGAPAMVCVKTFMPNPGQERELEEALHDHFHALKEAGLVRCVCRPNSDAQTTQPQFPNKHLCDSQTANPEPYCLRSRAGRVVEIFEWRDSEAMDEAHRNDATKATWEKLMAVSTLVPLASLGDTGQDYAHFQVINPKVRVGAWHVQYG